MTRSREGAAMTGRQIAAKIRDALHQLDLGNDNTAEHMLSSLASELEDGEAGGAQEAAARAQTIRDLEAGRITPEEIAAAGCVTTHLVHLRDDGWTIKHPLSCRPALFDCPINVAAVRDLSDPPDEPGVYECELDAGGRFVLHAGRPS